MNFKRNATYFYPTPDGRPPAPRQPRHLSRKTNIIILSVGVIIAAILIISSYRWWGAGAFIFTCVVLAFCNNDGVPSDAEIDMERDSYMNTLKEQALKKLGVDEEEIALAPPLFLKGYSLGSTILGDSANGKLSDKIGRDEIWRSPECVLSAFFFTEKEILYYRRIVSLVSDSYREFTEELFYNDIVSIRTEDMEKPWIDPKTGTESNVKKMRTSAFLLRNASGESRECVCNSTEEADNAVNALRSLIRQKKNA